MAESLSSGWTGLMKAGFGLRLEVFFLVFGMEIDYRFRRKRAKREGGEGGSIGPKVAIRQMLLSDCCQLIRAEGTSTIIPRLFQRP